jgi:hypothetical protein
MAKLQGSSTFNSLVIQGGISAASGSGFSNMVYFSNTTVSTSGTWYFPNELMVPGAKCRITLIGGGGGGGPSTAVAGSRGAGGGSGSIMILTLTLGSQLTYLASTPRYISYTAGGPGAAAGAGSASNVTYGGGTSWQAGGGGGGTATVGGTAGVNTSGSTDANTGATITNSTQASIGTGQAGYIGGVCQAAKSFYGHGGSPPFGWGYGGRCGGLVAGHNGLQGQGFGAGGSGGCSGSGTTIRTGGTGTSGFVMFEW